MGHRSVQGLHFAQTWCAVLCLLQYQFYTHYQCGLIHHLNINAVNLNLGAALISLIAMMK